MRKRRQRPLANCIEQTFVTEFGFQALKGFKQCAQSGAAHAFYAKLEFTTCFVERRKRPHIHLHAVLRLEGEYGGAIAKHDAAHLCRVVLENEVPMSACGAGNVGELARNPKQFELCLNEIARPAIQFGDRQRRWFGASRHRQPRQGAFGIEVEWGLVGKVGRHGAMLPPRGLNLDSSVDR